MLGKLSKKNIYNYDKNGYLFLKNFLSSSQKKKLKFEVDKVEKLPKLQKKKWMFYYEENKKKKLIARVENFLQYNYFLKNIFMGKKILKIISSLLLAKSEIYKEKINFKYPNGEGFKPHQDVAAGWKNKNRKYVTMAVAIDRSNLRNGCIEVVPKKHKDGLLGKKFKEIPIKIVNSNKWIKIVQNTGDVIFFDGFVPHRSKKNLSKRKRRIIFVTYCTYVNGKIRQEYFKKKRKDFPPDIERNPNKKYKYKI